MGNIKRLLCTAFIMLLLSGTALAENGAYMDDKDVNEASGDDTIAYHIYIGKAIEDVDASFAGMAGWERREHDKAARMYRRTGTNYIENVYLYPYPGNSDIVGSYRISFFTRTKEAADDIFFNTTKNLAYVLGRASIRRGGVSEEWIVSDSFKVSVEFVEYDSRLPVAKEYPYEIAIRRTTGNFGKFFEKSQATS